VLDVSKVPDYDPTNRKKMFRICLETTEQGRIPIGVMHRPKEAGRDGLETKLVGERKGPVRTDISLASNLEAYQKLLAGLS